jgi:hypothetical protein
LALGCTSILLVLAAVLLVVVAWLLHALPSEASWSDAGAWGGA